MAKGKRRGHGVLHAISRVILTLLLIGVLCACFCGMAFAYYVHAYINPSAQETAVDLSKGLGLDLNSFIYAVDPETGAETLYETIKGEENRIWVDGEQIPEDLKNAVVAIEDERFYKHSGVDWKRTFGAVYNWLIGDDQYGGSTITQQLIKNATDEKDYSIKRKINEIFRALALEKEIGDKDRILEMYLNTIYLGYNCYGVKTAATTYFGKDISELTLAESAVLAGLTNNPSIYDPYNHPDKVKERQEAILGKMLELQMIDQSTYNAAVAEELVYRPYEQYQADISDIYTYFADAVIKDLTQDLMEQKGYSEQVAKNMVASGGLKIYATIDTKVQAVVDAIWADDSVFPNTEKYGERPQSAMVITDKQGNIVAMAGGRGEKTENLAFSFATDARRQPGSSFKPLSTYGPAMDKGIITPSTTVYDKPLYIQSDGKPWPMNDGKMPTGSAMSIKSGITSSVNTIAVQVMDQLTPQASYDFLTQRLGIQLVGSRTYDDGTVKSDIDYSPLALGALTDGVTVREMAGGFSAFINEGVFGGTRTYTKVLDSEGNIVLENTPSTDLGFENVRTAYYMLECMQNVTAYGTASGTQISGVQTAGKTGTTTSNTDIWFCGVTPQYSAAVWVGYEHNYTLNGLYGRNAAAIWLKVMEKVHEGDSGLVFDSHPQDFTTVTYCMDTGLLASGACRAAGRAASGRFWNDEVPTETCSHQGISTSYNFAKVGVTDWKDEEEEEEEKPDEEQKPDEQTPTDPSIDPETGEPVTPTDPEGGSTGGNTGGGTTGGDPEGGGGTTDPGSGTTDPGGSSGGNTGGGTTDPGGSSGGNTGDGTTDPGGGADTPPPDDPEA
nr:transglycosylase domain-containing protein [uncultured Agathobaculum sp.]